MKPIRKINRREGQVQISISISKSLVEKIDKAAEKERRNRSNYIACALERLLDGAPIPR